MQNLIVNCQRRFMYKDYCAWPEDERWELIDGVAYDMSPAPARIHADILGELFVVFKNFMRNQPCKTYTAPFDVRLAKGNEPDDEVDTVVQPDILVVCDENKLDEKGCRGAPDLVVEILSPSTASKDCIQKRALYEKHGVKEFWIVDPVNRIITINTLNHDGLFGVSKYFAEEDTIEDELFAGLTIDFSAVFPPLPKNFVRPSPKLDPNLK